MTDAPRPPGPPHAPGPPLLLAQGARIAIDDAVVLDRLDLRIEGPRLLLLGDTSGLVGALTGVARGRADATDPAMAADARVVAGALQVLGRDVATLEHVGLIGAAPLDVPLPPTWTPLEYVLAAMRLGGVGRDRGAPARALRALTETGLPGGARRALRALAVPERRALLFAAALARDVRVVVADDPLAGLEGQAAAFVLAALDAATQGRAAIVSARAASAGGPAGVLAEHATDLMVLAGGEVAFVGTPTSIPAGARLWGLTVRANAAALGDELARRGIVLGGGPLRFSATVPEGAGPRDLVAAAVAARAPVVELMPLW